MLTKQFSFICLLMFCAFDGMAQTLTCTFQFTGSGTLGTRTFTNAAIAVTTVGDTTKLQSNDQPGYSLINNSASISISGVGSYQFTVPIFTVVATPGNNAPGTGTTVVGFGNAQNNTNLSSNASVVGGFFPGFNAWNMLSSIGPIQLQGFVTSWNRSTTPITTNGGTVNLYDSNYQAPPTVTFQATLNGTSPTPPLARSGVLSHIAAGGGWTTVITLVNNSSTVVPVTVALHDDSGNALSLPVTITNQGATQMTTSASMSATLKPNATLLTSTGDGIPSTSVGWAEVLSSGSIGGFAIFRQASPGGSSSEGTVPLTSQFTTITLPYDNTAGFVMGVALANLSTSFAPVLATVWDDSGNQLGTQSITVAGSGHTSFVVPTQVPLTAGKRGIVQFQSSGGIAGLGLRFSPYGTFTSVPTM